MKLTSFDMGLPRVDLHDKEAIQRVLDSDELVRWCQYLAQGGQSASLKYG